MQHKMQPELRNAEQIDMQPEMQIAKIKLLIYGGNIMSKVGDQLAVEMEKWNKITEMSPGVIEAFGQMRAAACPEDGVLDFKTIELISVAVAVARKCEPCMWSHVKCCVDAGVTREELAAALNPAILLCGGPGWAYAGKALDAFDQMSEDK